MEAPLSSPSLSGPSHQNQYFGASVSSSQQSTAPTSAPTSAPQTQAAPQQATQQAQRGDGTTPFLRDFNLVAEAAKRAQMAVLMRDFGEVGI